MIVDLAVVAAYSCVMLAVGWRSRRQTRESYWVAERQYGLGRISSSLVVTIFGASSTMGVIGLGYGRGLTGAWWPLIGAVALVPFGLALASRVRAQAVYTLPDVIHRAYGTAVSVPAGLMIAVSWCGIIAAQMVAGARLLSGLFPLEYSWALAVVAGVFILYTFWGGQLSVIRTDSWQLVLFVAGLLICLLFLGLAPAGAVELPSEHLQFPVSSSFGWYELIVFYPLIVGLPYLVGPDLYTRVLSARDGRVARKSVLVAAAAVVPIAFLLAVVGILIRLRFPEVAPEAALPTALGQLLPVGLRGLIVAAFLAAIMSSADTTLVTASTILSLNVIAPFKPLSENRQLTTTKIGVVVIGLAAWLIAGFQQGIISSLLLGYTIFVGGVVVPTVASFYRERLGITSTAALCSVLLGGGSAILGKIQEGALLRDLLGSGGDAFFQRILGPQYASILPLLLSLAAIILVSPLTRHKNH